MKRQRITITLRQDLFQKVDALAGGKFQNRSKVIETILDERFQGDKVKKAVILGGRKEATLKGKPISKLLFPLSGGTLLDKNIEVLKSFGVTDFMFSIKEQAESVRNFLRDGAKHGIKVQFFERDRGTAGVLRQTRSLMGGTFLMMNGDILLDGIDLHDMFEFHRKNNGLATILVANAGDPSKFGSLVMKGSKIVSFEEKTEEARSFLINGGVYLLEPEVCEMVSPGFESLENDIFPQLAKEGKFCGYHLSSPWVHLHDEKHYNNYLNKIKNKK